MIYVISLCVYMQILVFFKIGVFVFINVYGSWKCLYCICVYVINNYILLKGSGKLNVIMRSFSDSIFQMIERERERLEIENCEVWSFIFSFGVFFFYLRRYFFQI